MAAVKPLRYQQSFFIDSHFQCPPSTNIQQLLLLVVLTTTTTTITTTLNYCTDNQNNNHINEDNNEEIIIVLVLMLVLERLRTYVQSSITITITIPQGYLKAANKE